MAKGKKKVGLKKVVKPEAKKFVCPHCNSSKLEQVRRTGLKIVYSCLKCLKRFPEWITQKAHVS
jgi:transcription elongation factor Elf1